jgi:ElaB/YqjD/DUF883 family membrane-anchored ribosome-binding protein
MEEHQNPEEAAKRGQEHLQSAAGDLKEAASAKVENIRQAAEQKADELREAAQGKAEELRGAAENAKSQAKSWQAGSEAYIRENPTRAILVALGIGILLGLLLRE